jgi:hypothetical protein
MKQTAVQWLKNEMAIKVLRSGRLSKSVLDLFEQALEMEKEQIIEAHGLIAKLQEDGSHKLISGETYYDETYKPSAY